MDTQLSPVERLPDASRPGNLVGFVSIGLQVMGSKDVERHRAAPAARAGGAVRAAVQHREPLRKRLSGLHDESTTFVASRQERSQVLGMNGWMI